MPKRFLDSPFAKKSLGQNFLVDPNYVRKIVDAVSPQETDTIIEIGPGRGAITEKLIESEANVVAIELDRDLVPKLRSEFSAFPNFHVIEADATETDFGNVIPTTSQSAVSGRRFKLVANLPYYISTAILQHLFLQRNNFSSLVLMFQKEVVDRIAAKPGDSDRGFLTVLTEAAFKIEKLFDVPATAFRPVPKVTSSVVRLVPKPRIEADEAAFRDLASKAFAHKRKTILNNLRSSIPNVTEALEYASIDPNRRAESLTLDEWIKLYKAINANS